MQNIYLPLMQAKLHPPQAEVPLVDRARLTMLFRRKLTLVIAPAGYGKTSLLTQAWQRLTEDAAAGAWLTLDASDNDLAQFVRCFVGAIRVARPGFGEPVIVLLQGGVSLSDDTIVRVLANELAAIPGPFRLFLEDVHELADPRAIAALRQLVAGTPPNVQFAISSRKELELGLGRLRATGQLCEIDWSALRFTDGEVREFFRRTHTMELSTELVAHVLAKTEGWAAALQLTSLSARDSSALASLMDRLDGDERGIASYLAEDVLARLPPELSEFLLHVGPLNRVCALLCNAITGRTDGAAILERIVAANLFVFASDGERRWYRFHPLFSSFLCQQLERRTPGALQELYARTSEWFEGVHAWDEAVDYALRAGSIDRAAQILDAHAFDIWRAGQQSRLDGWARQIPTEIRCRYPRLRLAQAWSLTLAGKVAAAIRILEEVSAQFDAHRDAGSVIFGDVLFLRLMIAFFKEDNELAESLSENWLAGGYSTDPFLVGAVKSVLAGSRGLMYELAYATEEAMEIAECFEDSGTSYGPIWFYSILGAIQLGAGYLAASVVSLERAIAFAVRVGGAGTPLAAMPAMVLARACFELGDIEAARDLASRYALVADHLNFADYQISVFYVPARLHSAAGNVAAALATLEHHEACSIREPHRSARVDAHLVNECLRVLARLKRTREIMQVAARAGFTSAAECYLPTRAGGALAAVRAEIRIRVALAADDPREALALARKWIRYTHERRSQRPELGFRLLAAVALLALGEQPAARRELRDALLLGASTGALRPFLDEDDAIRPLLYRAASMLRTLDPAARNFLERLLPQLGRVGEDVPVASEARGDAPSGMSAKLTPREIEVLQLVAAGLSNREVGEGLGLTENTVKWNLRQLFQKLSVQRRSQAILRAREVGLIA